jgi:glutaredoxin
MNNINLHQSASSTGNSPEERKAMSAITLYSATGCPLCAKYKSLLASRGLDYEEKNTTETPAYLQELADKGIRMVPTVFVGELFVAGFRPTSLMELLAKL